MSKAIRIIRTKKEFTSYKNLLLKRLTAYKKAIQKPEKQHLYDF